MTILEKKKELENKIININQKLESFKENNFLDGANIIEYQKVHMESLLLEDEFNKFKKYIEIFGMNDLDDFFEGYLSLIK